MTYTGAEPMVLLDSIECEQSKRVGSAEMERFGRDTAAWPGTAGRGTAPIAR
jgi:hypothetical protein